MESVATRKCQYHKAYTNEGKCEEYATHTAYSNSHGNQYFLCQKHFNKVMSKAGWMGTKGIDYIL
jgi:hypothetical protein